jgi:hypothetical protein
MGILDESSQEPDYAKAAAARIVNETRMTYRAVLEAFNGGARFFWRNECATPEQIALALGTDAKEVFELHARLGAFIAGIDPGLIQRGLAVVGTVVYNEDGTVTVTQSAAEDESNG